MRSRPRITTGARAIDRLALTIALVASLSACSGGPTPAGSAAAAPGGGSSSPATPGEASDPGPVAGGGDTIKRDGTGTINACALLSAAQISTAVGSPVVTTTPYGDTECRWTVEPLTALPDAEEPWLDVQFWPNESFMTAVEDAPATNGVVEVAGLGDRAFRTNTFRHLWVQNGTDVFVVRSRLMGISDETEGARDAAEAVELLLARLVLDQL